MSESVSESEFNMWRAVFAFSLVDHVLTLEEQELLKSYKAKVPFSKEQLEILGKDFKNPQDIEALYNKITEKDDKKRFCVLARALVWSDGDMDAQETEILKRVACLKAPEGREILSGTRDHPHINTYYQEYAKAGVMGLFNVPHQLDMLS